MWKATAHVKGVGMSMLQLMPGVVYNRKLGLQGMQLRQTIT